MSDSLLVTVAETAALLRISGDTIKRQIRLGLIPIKRIRSSVRISRAWIDSYVAECAPVLLTRRQVAVKLGIGQCAMRSLLRKGLLPVVTVGKLQRIPAAAVAEYVKRNQFAFLRTQAKLASVPRPARPDVPVAVPVRRLGFGSVRGV